MRRQGRDATAGRGAKGRDWEVSDGREGEGKVVEGRPREESTGSTPSKQPRSPPSLKRLEMPPPGER